MYVVMSVIITVLRVEVNLIDLLKLSVRGFDL